MVVGCWLLVGVVVFVVVVVVVVIIIIASPGKRWRRTDFAVCVCVSVCVCLSVLFIKFLALSRHFPSSISVNQPQANQQIWHL